MARRPRDLTESDTAEWARYARTIRPLHGRRPPVMAEPAIPAADSAPAPPQPWSAARHAPVPARLGPLSIGGQPAGVDTSSWTRFQRGKLGTGRKLDLHGMTAQHAFHALRVFLHTAHADRLRCVEVVTGRGSGENGGVIRRELPLWLNLPDIRPMVLAASHPHAANPGSVRLLLRRPKGG